ncbi:MAG: hypothetical protein J5601_03865 [Elusimicrobiaceae bacterium]|nr:hypothetical protein [Elusimicrobiaceae bacterium]
MEDNEINKDKVIEYMLANEKARYEAVKAVTGTIKHIVITLILAVTVCLCFYMYYVTPAETEEVIIDGNSKAAINNTGSEIWQ